jgi:site-specific recombinase XerD
MYKFNKDHWKLPMGVVCHFRKRRLIVIGTRGWIKTEKEIREFAKRSPDILNKGAYLNLMNQLNRIAKHSKGISTNKSLPQYYNHVDRFCRFLADNYNLKNLANIQNKHLVAYVIERQSEGKSAATVKNDLAAIRYFHNQFPKTRYQLSDNKTLAEKYPEFTLEKRSFGGVNRRPTEMEYQGLLTIARNSKNKEIADIIFLAREQGLRIHEGVRLDRTDAEKAVREGFLTVKGKGGLIRQVPLRSQTIAVLRDAMNRVSRGHKLFVRDGEKAHQVIQRVQDFVKNNRQKVWDPANTRPEGVEITMHSFRHAYAKEEYNRFIKNGMSEKQARFEVSKLIGHSREDVTRIYLAD